MLQGSCCLTSITISRTGGLLVQNKVLSWNIHWRNEVAVCISGKFMLYFWFHCISSSHILLTHLWVRMCVCVCVGFCGLVQTNLCECCSPISMLKLGEQNYIVHIEGSFVCMPRSLDLGCGILLLSGVEVGYAERTASWSDVFALEKNLIAIE